MEGGSGEDAVSGRGRMRRGVELKEKKKKKKRKDLGVL